MNGYCQQFLLPVIWQQVQDSDCWVKILRVRWAILKGNSPQRTSHSMALQNQNGFLVFLVKIGPLNNSTLFFIKNTFQLLHILSASSIQRGLESDATVLLSAQSLPGVAIMLSGWTHEPWNAPFHVSLLDFQWMTNVLRTPVMSLHSQFEALG